MKILLVAPQPYFVERGTPIAVRQLARTLQKQGHELHLLAYPIGADPGDDGVRLHRCPRLPFIQKMPIGFSIRKLLYDVPLSVWIYRLHIRYRFEVIHAIEETVYPALTLKWFSNIRVIYDMDSSLADQLCTSQRWLAPARRFLESCEAWAIRNADKVAAVCDDLVDIAAQVKSRDAIHALYDVPNTEYEGRQDNAPVDDITVCVPSHSLVGLYVGNLEPYQGINLLLESLQQLPKETALGTVIIGGTTEHIRHYQQIADGLGVREHVHFIGPRPLEHLDQLLKQADILFSPRITGGNTPMKLYSYMAAARPILATNLSTHTQVLDNQHALLTEPSPAQYAQGILRLMSDEPLRRRLAKHAAELVQQRYSMEHYEETVRQMYAELT